MSFGVATGTTSYPADPDFGDLAGQVEGISEFRQTPWQAKAATEKARIRRDQKAATMRKLRAGDRASAPWKVWRFGL